MSMRPSGVHRQDQRTEPKLRHTSLWPGGGRDQVSTPSFSQMLSADRRLVVEVLRCARRAECRVEARGNCASEPFQERRSVLRW